MNLRMFLDQSNDLSDLPHIDEFASHWKREVAAKGGHITWQEQPETREYILLEGTLTSRICDYDGKEICVGFYVAPCVVTPNIARTRDGVSLVSIIAETDVVLARIDTEVLLDCMISSEPIRRWANGVLRTALSEKAEREWCLAALGGADRLRWFRGAFAGHESIFKHAAIASFLGMTPVTLSRLRTGDSQG